MNETYREVFGEILADHHEAPRNWGKLSGEKIIHEHGYNPLCGDKVDIYVAQGTDGVTQVQYEGEGCSICMASASIMSEIVTKLHREEILKWIEAFRAKMQGAEGDVVKLLPADQSGDDLTALYGVKRFPVRIKCALLPWTTLKKALEHGQLGGES